jgi:SAM-dependent methyltransferase
MGRFESTVPFYSLFREPYPPEFFSEVARQLDFRGTERLLDIACGPGMLAIGFAPFVGSCVGLDPEEEMISAAREQAAQSNVLLELVQSRLEDLPNSLGPFQVATIGRALHWLDRRAAPQTLAALLPPGAFVLICHAKPPEAQNLWLSAFNKTRRQWSSNPEENCYRIDVDDWFRAVPFRRLEDISVTYRQYTTTETLIGRALSMSTTSPAFLGDRREAFEAAVVLAVEPFTENGVITEEILAKALVFQRTGG